MFNINDTVKNNYGNEGKIIGISPMQPHYLPDVVYYTVAYKGDIGPRNGQPETSLVLVPKTCKKKKATSEPPKVFGPMHKEFLDMLQEHGKVRLQYIETDWLRQSDRYLERTGQPLTPETPGVSRIHGNKWGSTWSVMFPAEHKCLMPAFIKPWPNNGKNPAGMHGFNNIKFVLELLSLGFRIGSKHEYKSVLDNPPPVQ